MQIKPRDPQLLTEGERLIRELHEIGCAYDRGFEWQVCQMLELGLALFQLDIAILSKVVDDTYEVKHVVGPDTLPVEPGTTFSLSNTYCSHTLSANGPVGFRHAGEEIGGHPCYKAFQLESYIGVPLVVEGKTYGTLNFSSPAKLPRAWRPQDVECLQLMATWISGELVRQQLVASLESTMDELASLATTDPLTQIANRRGAEERIQRMKHRALANGEDVAVVLVDVDDFKSINDTHGHSVGDHALRCIAEAIQETVRPGDLVARIGGDEFVAAFTASDEDVANQVAERIREAVGEIALEVERPPDRVSVSLGVALVESAADLGSILHAVESGLKRAKAAGKNCVASAQ